VTKKKLSFEFPNRFDVCASRSDARGRRACGREFAKSLPGRVDGALAMQHGIPIDESRWNGGFMFDEAP